MYSNNYYKLARTKRYNFDGTEAEMARLNNAFPVEKIKILDSRFRQELKQYYDPKKHQHFLIYSCFKNPFGSTQQVYDAFRKQHYPDMQQPPISCYYSNKCFIPMIDMIEWFKKQQQDNYPSIQKTANPKQVFHHLNVHYGEINYTPNLERFLLLYPVYFNKFSKFRETLFMDEIICYMQAYFLVLVTAIQMGCPYMIFRASSCLLIHGAPKDWILQRKYPKRLEHLFPMVRKMAKAPWQITKKDLDYYQFELQLANCDLLLYLQAITWAISACTISLAIGLQPEQPSIVFNVEQIQKIKKNYDDIVYESLPDKKIMFEQIHEYLEQNQDISSKQLKQLENKQIQPYMKAIAKQMDEQKLYEKFNIETNQLMGKYNPSEKRKDDNRQQYTDEIIQKYVQSRMKQQLKLCGDKFWDLTKFSLNMTYTNFGAKKQNDTKNFRRAIQYYSQILLGVTHDEFSYKKQLKMNVNTTMPLRFYVRLLTLHPSYIKKQVLDEINHESENEWMKMFDLGHLALLVADTKARVITSMIYKNMEF